MSGIIKQQFTKNRNYDAMALLDRDGTIIQEVGYLNGHEQVRLLPGVAEGIKLLNKNNIAVVVITNQPVVAHDLLSVKGLKEINTKLRLLLSGKGAFIDGIYSCPHHPDAPNAKYKSLCRCRKPNTLLYKYALKDFPAKKILGVIGDTTRDIQFGKNIKVPTVLVQTGYKGKDDKFAVKPDFTGKNFLECVNILLNLK